MKTSLRLTLFFFAFFLALTTAMAQTNSDIEISKNKVLIAGKVFYVHYVQKGQTLYAIAKAYHVTQQQIIDENPEAGYGIREGQALKISELLQKDKFEIDKNNANYQIHKIEAGQTLYAIAKLYNLRVEDLIAVNPSLSAETVKVGQTIKIPTKIEIPNEKLVSSDDYLWHEVQAKETLFGISKQYNTSVSDIIALNDTSLAGGLKIGQKIKIPHEKIIQNTIKPVQQDTKKTEPASIPVPVVNESSDCTSLSNTHNTYNVGVMLPFFSQVSERKGDVEPNSEDSEVKGNEPVSSNFLEFYEGFLLAASSLKDSGISVNVYSFDTERNTNRVVALLQKPEFEKLDLIVGPLLPENIRIASEYAKKNSIPLVSPLSARSEFVKNNPYVFQLNPSTDVIQYQLAKYLARPGKRTVILYYSPDAKDLERCTNLKKLIKQLVNNEVEVKLLSGSQAIVPSLSVTHENMVVLTSNEELFVTSALRKIYDASRTHNLTVVGNQSWQRMRNLDQEMLYRIGLEYCTPYYVDYESERVKTFLLKFKSVYGYEPYRQSSFGFIYGMYGYDVGLQFIQALNKYGRNLGGCINTISTKPVNASFFFSNDTGSGFVNQAVSIVKYNSDYTITRKLVILK